MLPLLGLEYCRLGVREHPGDRAYHRAGGCPDALALQGQIPAMLVLSYALSWRALLWPRR
jgi:hypothetical protein